MRRADRWMLAVVGWLVAAILVGGSGILARTPPPVPQMIVAGLTVALILGERASTGFRTWLDGLPLRTIVAFHATRLVGIGFLVSAAQGGLARGFAVPAGWGDIAIAVSAIALALTAARRPVGWRWFLAWNAAGAVDILLVVVLAARMAMANPASMAPLFRLPLSLVPTFLVPIIIASHALVFRRLARSGPLSPQGVKHGRALGTDRSGSPLVGHRLGGELGHPHAPPLAQGRLPEGPR